ncbi:HEAT repeat domain-containing protein [Actinoplanes sp. NPDC026619]|uniref:HEAT repeat domain-containing protein n=1 Tax=Actinoplanes sp. NPDC026619 TaxID=3155798 RepID=UPI0033E77728
MTSTPKQRIELACATRGAPEVVAGCLALIGGGDTDPELVEILSNPAGPRYLDAPPDQRYWLRVWGVRGLRWALCAPDAPAAHDPDIVEALLSALADESWRVRENATKVVAQHRVDAAQPAIAALLTDEIPRVRAAAARALRLLTN